MITFNFIPILLTTVTANKLIFLHCTELSTFEGKYDTCTLISLALIYT